MTSVVIVSQQPEPVLHQIHRGGLIIVNELIYNLFVAFEQEVRRHLSISNAADKVNLKELILREVVTNKDVLLNWETLSRHRSQKSYWTSLQDNLLPLEGSRL